MRIHYLCADRGIRPGGTKGASIHFRSLAAALRDAGHEVNAWMSAADEEATSFPVALRPLRSIQPLLAAETPDFICERYSLGSVMGLEASRHWDVPFVLEVNAPLVDEARAYRPRSLQRGDVYVEQLLFRQADLVVTVSEPLRRKIAAVRGTDEGTAVLRNGCTPQPKARPDRDSRLLVFLGHPKPWHGAERLPHVLAKLPGTRLRIIGGGPGVEPVLENARRYGVEGRIEITGAVAPNEVGPLLSDAAVAVAPYPSLPCFYFCPLKVIECMAAGLPVVTTRQGDLPGIVGDTGVLVPPDETGAFAAAVGSLLVDAPLRARLGSSARRRVLRNFTWSKTAQRLVHLATALTPVA